VGTSPVGTEDKRVARAKVAAHHEPYENASSVKGFAGVAHRLVGADQCHASRRTRC
jgi:hypothetical protein